MTDNIASIRRSLQLLCVIACFVTAYFAKDLILPVLLGFLLALTLSPVARGMARMGIPSGVSAVLLVGTAGAMIFVLVGLSANTISSWSNELQTMGAQIQSRLAGMADTVETVRETTEQVEKISKGGEDDPQRVVVEQPGLLSSAMNAGVTLGGTIAVMLVLALFLLASGNLFYVKLVQSFQTFTGKKRALAAVYDVERRVSRYLLTITLINAGLGLCVGSFLYLLGLPGAYIFGIAAFLLNFLPYIGGVIGSVIVGAYAIITFDTVGYALLAPLGYQALTTIEGQFITPWLVGRRLNMNTVAVFLTVVFWGWLWGIAGALIAVPFLVVFKVVCENVEALHLIGNFLDSSEQRMETAMNEPEP
ncbi:AI-2E family transporter [Sulfitobacter albidus]|uniref:AI-2E family transporter n=1 Tax=Sulfitobacter albidus TaxID=2829501 RepID=UPI0020C89097|nr:AI-2E family transporter [Sulfitobacter albidus]